jgi:hypothetical protein
LVCGFDELDPFGLLFELQTTVNGRWFIDDGERLTRGPVESTLASEMDMLGRAGDMLLSL